MSPSRARTAPSTFDRPTLLQRHRERAASWIQTEVDIVIDDSDVHGAATEHEIVATHGVRVRGQIVHLDDPADAAERALRDDDATDDLARPGRAGSDDDALERLWSRRLRPRRPAMDVSDARCQHDRQPNSRPVL